MRGMVFTELLELVEEKFGYDTLDDVIDGAKLENDGAYTATGSYPFEELVRIVVSLSEHTNIPVDTLLEVYGEHLFLKLLRVVPEFDKQSDILKFIESVELFIHVQVKKLYSNVELPTFEIVSSSENELNFYYISNKNIPQFAKGLMIGASKHFGQEIEIAYKSQADGKVLFNVKKV